MVAEGGWSCSTRPNGASSVRVSSVDYLQKSGSDEPERRRWEWELTALLVPGSSGCHGNGRENPHICCSEDSAEAEETRLKFHRFWSVRTEAPTRVVAERMEVVKEGCSCGAPGWVRASIHSSIHQSNELSIHPQSDGSAPLMSSWLQLQARDLSSPFSDALSICFPSFHPSSVPAGAQ